MLFSAPCLVRGQLPRRPYTFQNLCLGQQVGRVFGALENALYQLGRVRNAAPFQPEMHVRLATHRADLDDLLEPEEMGWHTRIDAVCQHLIVLSISLDDRRGMDAGGGLECVFAHNGIVGRNRNTRRVSDRFAVILQLRQALAGPWLDAMSFRLTSIWSN